MTAERSKCDELGPSSSVWDWRVLSHGANVTQSSGRSSRAIVTTWPRTKASSLSSPTLQKPRIVYPDTSSCAGCRTKRRTRGASGSVGANTAAHRSVDVGSCRHSPADRRSYPLPSAQLGNQRGYERGAREKSDDLSHHYVVPLRHGTRSASGCMENLSSNSFVSFVASSLPPKHRHWKAPILVVFCES